LTGQHVKDLGQLVKARPTQEASDSRDPRVIGDLEDRSLGLVQVLELREKAVSSIHHRAELQHAKAALVETHPVLNEEHRAWRVEFDRRSDEADYGYRHRDHEQSEGEVHEPLDEELPFFLRDRFERQQWNGSELDEPRARDVNF